MNPIDNPSTEEQLRRAQKRIAVLEARLREEHPRVLLGDPWILLLSELKIGIEKEREREPDELTRATHTGWVRCLEYLRNMAMAELADPSG